MQEVLIIKDSRARHLEPLINQQLLDRHINATVVVLCIPWGTIECMTKRGWRLLNNQHFDLTILFGGVCDLSHKTRTGVLVPIFHSMPALVNYFTNILHWSWSYLHTACPNIIIAPLIGLHLDTVNLVTANVITILDPYQTIIDNSIRHVNAVVQSINMATGGIAPWLSNTIHMVQHATRYHRYNRLRDGLHPTSYLLNIWATKFVNSIRNNLPHLH